MKNKKTVLLTLLLLIAAFIAVTFFYENSVDTKTQALATNSSAKGTPFVRDHSPVFGENKNKITITEFLDPECESCRAFHPVIKEVFNDYKIETQLAIRYLAFHKNSKFAVKLLESARLQGKFNETLEVIFKYQPQWAQHNNEKPALLWDFLKETSLDMEKLRKDFDTIDVDDILAIDSKDATTLGVTGTPTFYVNGKVLRDLNYKALLDLVESEIYK